MRKFYFAAATALLLVTTSAQAGSAITFDVNGQRVSIETPPGCNSLSCIQISTSGYKGKLGNIDLGSFGSKDKNDDVPSPPASVPAPVQSTAVPPPPAPSAMVPAPPAPVTNDATPAPAQVAVAPAPAPVAAAPAPAPVAAAPVQIANSPIGVWATEENKGNVRIEMCGDNLCGYALKNNEQILINMKPSDAKWVGRIHDPESGRTYDSTMVLRGPNALRVEGCAMGGLFCGGQTWKRVS